VQLQCSKGTAPRPTSSICKSPRHLSAEYFSLSSKLKSILDKFASLFAQIAGALVHVGSIMALSHGKGESRAKACGH
jgi:hypothetical protein